MKQLVGSILLVALLGSIARPALAAVNVERSGSENPMVEVAKSTVYGALAGVVVGGAIALASNSDGTAVKWGFVVGTFAGLGYGLVHVATRPSASLIELGGGHAASGGLAALEAGPGGVRVHAIGLRF